MTNDEIEKKCRFLVSAVLKSNGGPQTASDEIFVEAATMLAVNFLQNINTIAAGAQLPLNSRKL